MKITFLSIGIGISILLFCTSAIAEVKVVVIPLNTGAQCNSNYNIDDLAGSWAGAYTGPNPDYIGPLDQISISSSGVVTDYQRINSTTRGVTATTATTLADCNMAFAFTFHTEEDGSDDEIIVYFAGKFISKTQITGTYYQKDILSNDGSKKDGDPRIWTMNYTKQ